MNRLQRAWLLQDNTPRTAYHPSGRPKGTSSPTPPGLPGRVLPAATNPGSAFHGSYAVSPVARHRHSQPQPSVARPPVPVTIPAAAAPASAAESSAAASGSMPQFGSGAAQRSNGSGPDLLPAAAERGMDNGSAEAGACYQQFNYDLERIWDAIEELQDEAATLRSCLMDTQILDQDFFLARLHERRCAMNPIEGTATFAQAAEFEDVMKLLLQFGDVQDMQAIGLASVSVGQSMRLVAQDLFIASLHVFGGEDGQRALNTSERFNEVTHSWEPVANMSDARAFALTNKLAGRLYVCGGTIGGESLRSAERFDPIAGTWEVLPEMQHARATALSVALGGCIYIIGGAAGEGCLSSVERYDPTAGPQGAWETMPSMREPRAAATGTAIGEHIYVCGGREGQRVLDSSERFDPASGTWVELPPRPPGRAYAVAAEIQGKLYLCGGATTAGFLNTAECFDPALGFWRDLPSMADRRRLNTAVPTVQAQGNIKYRTIFNNSNPRTWSSMCQVVIFINNSVDMSTHLDSRSIAIADIAEENTAPTMLKHIRPVRHVPPASALPVQHKSKYRSSQKNADTKNHINQLRPPTRCSKVASAG